MADNVIDELSLQIDANANAAIKSLSQMQIQLRNLARDIGRVSAASSSFNRLANSIKAIGSVSGKNLKTTVEQLEKLSQTDFSKLSGKDITINFKVVGADKAERLQYALKDAEKTLDASKMSDKLAKAFSIEGDPAKKLKSQVEDAFKALAKGDETSYRKGSFGIIETISESGKIARKDFDESVALIKQEYASLVSYLISHPLKVPSPVTNKGNFFETLGLSDYQRKNYFRKNGNGIDTVVESLRIAAPNMMVGFDETRSDLEQIEDLFARILDAKKKIGERQSIGSLTGEDSANAYTSIMETVNSMQKKVLGSFNAARDASMRESANKIPLDVSVDPVRIRQKIEEALAEATKQEFQLPIKFSFEELEKDVKTSVTNTFDALDAGKLGALSVNMQSVAKSMVDLANSNAADSGVRQLINSLKRLTEVDMSNFNGSVFTTLASDLQSIANVGDVSSAITKLVSSLARLADAGKNTQFTARALPRLGYALREVISGITSAGAIPSEINTFVGALSQLANVGNKALTTAENLKPLGNAIREFIASLQNTPAVNESITRIVESVATLSQAGAKTKSAAKGISKAVDDVSTQKSANRLQGLKTILEELGKSFGKVASLARQGASKIVSSLTSIKSAGLGLNSATASIKNMIAAMIGFRGVSGIANLSKQMLTLGGDITEIDHIVESVFGDMASAVNNWANEAISQFGIASHSAKRYAGVLSAMFQASGLAQKDAGMMGIKLTELAGDLSAFYNIDTETAFKKIQSGMAGMVRPLRDLGIDLTAATLSEYAMAQGIQKKYSEMTQAEKIMLRYNYLLSATEQQQGDFALTAKSYANSLRTLKANFAALGTQIGSGLTAAIRPALVMLNQLMQYLIKAAASFATFMKTLFPFKNGAKGFAFDASAMEEDVSGVADASEGIADGLDDASDAAKKLKKDLSVLPFDELNQLNKDTQSTSSGKGSGGAGAGGLGDLGEGLLDWDDYLNEGEAGKIPDAISKWAERVKKAFKDQNWDKLGEELAWGINEGIKKVYEALDFEKFKKRVDPFITGFTKTFNSLIKNVDWNTLGKTVGAFVNNLVYTANRLLTEINWKNIGKSIASGLNGLLDEVNFTELGKMFGNKFMVLWKTLYGFASDFNWKTFGKKLGDGINGINEAISWTTVARALTRSLNGLFTSLLNFTKTVKWGDIAKNITDGINTFIREFDWEKNGKALGEFIKNLCDTLITIIDKTDWDEFGKGLAKMLQEIPWGKLLEVVGKVIVNALGGILKGMASTPAGFFATALIGALAAFKIGSSLMPLASGIVTALTGKTVGTLIAGGASSLMTTFGTTISGAFPVITGAISAGWTTITSIVGSAVTAIGTALAAITPAGWIVIGVIAGAAAITAVIVKNWDKIKDGAKKLGETLKTAWDSISKKTKDTFEKVKTNTLYNWELIKIGVSMASDTIKSKAVSTWDNIKTKVEGVATSVKEKVLKAWDSIKTTTATVFDAAKEKVKGAWQSIKDKTSPTMTAITSSVTKNFNSIKTIVNSVIGVVQPKIESAWNNIKTKTETTFNRIQSSVSTTFGRVQQTFSTILDSMKSKAETIFGKIKNAIGETLSKLQDTFGQKWSLDISKSTPHIPVPHFQKTGSFSLNPPSVPKYTFSGWWAKGGLFKGGNGQLIGIAENHKDEAVLPLQDNRAMAQIGSAIARASGNGLGISREDITDAVVMAMAMNPQSQEIIVNAVLKMENDEVLARHVERGRQRLDSRYNPVAQY